MLLSAAKADYNVVLNDIFVHDKFIDQKVIVPNRFVTGREFLKNSELHLENWEVVKDRYEVVQNIEILKRAKNLVNRNQDSTVLFGCGVLDEGRKFFCVINTGSLQVHVGSDDDDIIDSYVIIMTSHDASLPICYYCFDTRRSTNAVYRIDSPRNKFIIRKRHTPAQSNYDIEVADALMMRRVWTEELQRSISKLYSPISMATANAVILDILSCDDDLTDKKKDNVQMAKSEIVKLYTADHNAGFFGQTKWALFNAFVEYVDFGRNINSLDAAQHSLEIDNFSHRLKISAYKKISTI
jgi:hypothetical protein